MVLEQQGTLHGHTLYFTSLLTTWLAANVLPQDNGRPREEGRDDGEGQLSVGAVRKSTSSYDTDIFADTPQATHATLFPSYLYTPVGPVSTVRIAPQMSRSLTTNMQFLSKLETSALQ